MKNKLLLSLTAVLFGFMSLGYVEANNNEYTMVPRNPETHAAYIDAIYQQNGKIYVTADFIDWYEGEEANKIFREIEKDPEMTEAPDGYYIVNDDIQLQTIEVAADAEVLMQIYNRTGNLDEANTNWNEEMTVTKFISLFSDDSEMNLKDFPYHLSIQDGHIVKITQQFIP
jgi:hypothetical protein